MEKMSAFRLYRDGHYGVEQVQVPEISDDEVLVRVRGAAICHSDVDFITGKRSPVFSGDSITLGHEYAGEVAAVGKNVRDFSIGDKVVCEGIIWCGKCRQCKEGQTPLCTENGRAEHGCVNYDGGFAEYAVSRPDMLIPFKNMSFETAACVEPAGNASHIIDYADIKSDDIVVIIGPGPIGLYATALAKNKKPKMVITVGTRKCRLDLALQMGADYVVNINECDAYERILEITGGRKCNTVMQCATTQSALELGKRLLGLGGKLLIEGLTGQSEPFCFDELIYNGWTVVGVAGSRHADYLNVTALAEAGEIDLSIPVTTVIPLDEIEDGFRKMLDKSTNTVKVVVTP